MSQTIGAIASLYEDQKKSCLEMIKSFRHYNPKSSIIILCDGLVNDINDICKEYKCDALIFNDKLGYPASENVEIPMTYIYRFLCCSRLIKENFYINLEPDCLVTAKLEVDDDCNSIFLTNTKPMWLYYFVGDDSRRNCILPKMMNLYKKYNVYDFKNDRLFDKLIGGGGFIFNKNFFLNLLNDWNNYKNYCFLMDEIYKEHPVNSSIFNDEKRWFSDYLLSLTVQFYSNKKDNFNFDVEKCFIYESNLFNNIIHPYKKFYI